MSGAFGLRAAVVRVVVALCGCLALVAPPAGAVEAKPFEITRFTLQATAPTQMLPLHEGHLGKEEAYEFVNEPTGFTQAGGHPWGLTYTGEVTSEVVGQEQTGGEIQHRHVPTQDLKDIVVNLPAGLLGDPLAVPRCPLTTALAFPRVKCPPASQIGVFRLLWFGGKQYLGPIVNAVPEAGQSAEFVLQPNGALPFVETAHLVHTPEGYGFTVVSNEIPGVLLVRVEQTFWGVPGDPSHDAMRGMSCASSDWGIPLGKCEGGGQPGEVAPVPFLSLGTDCSGGPQTASMRADSWEQPGSVGVNGQYSPQWQQETTTMPGVTGCSLLVFSPSLEVQPDTLTADEPVGLGVDVHVPQPEQPGVLQTPHLRDAVVTLPLGMSVSPGVVDGIRACQAQGPEGINIEGPESERVAANGEWQLAPGKCPDASTVGTAEAITPLLPEPVKGHVYLARPGCGGAGQHACTAQDALDGNLYKLYLELGGTGALGNTGIEIKVEGQVDVSPANGQITTKFLQNPQTPFSDLKIHLDGGPRAPLDNPSVCGQAVTTSDFTPWSAPGITPEGLAMAGTPDATPSSSFGVEGCTSPPAFAPGFLAGTVTPNAGKFSAFTMNLSRKDREQYVKGVQVHTPPGLLAMLSNVPLCPEAQANDPSKYGECTASKIGTTRVASGAGSHPFEIEGNVYLTGPHDGAPFGLSVVTHAVAGPFNLGLVVVRARIDIDPNDSTATITTDETGPYALPQIIFGVPLRLQRITVNIDRPGFMFNPTSCTQQQITAQVSGSQDAVASVSSQFAVGNCTSLAFKPKFTVSTNGHTSRANGASLDVKLSYPKGAMGKDANIARVKVDLPRQLPSYLPTLQKACLAATFAANPAACPKGSIVGVARASTPLLPVGLSGPVYFVSHGGEAFPSLIIVLEGDGVRVDLTGSTFIDKAGITSSTFRTVPDVPVDTFELYLPQGKGHALAANTNLCKSQAKLVMPTEFVAQNGIVVKQRTKIKVSGCTRANAAIATRRRGQHGHPNRRSGR
jgi:hypothetical protein